MAVIIWRACVWRLWLLSLGLCLAMVAGAAEPLDAGDRLGDDAFVLDASGQAVKLRQRMAQSDAGLTVLCLLGGGEMGAQSGRLWCADALQDTYILRSLYAKYAKQGVISWWLR